MVVATTDFRDQMDGGATSTMSASGFFNYVFNFDNDNKANMLNMVQYILIALIPVVLVLKTIKYYVPEEDDLKGTPEVAIEVAMQLFAIFFAIWFIDRIVRYIPTYSGVNYHKFNEINLILPLLIILVTMQTKLGAKINILAERFMDLWNGSNQTGQVGNSQQGAVRVSQPIVTPGIHQVSRADALDNTINPQAGQMPAQNNISMIDALPNMMQQGSAQGGGNGLSNFQSQAIQNSFMEAMEPMAANGALGGAFGSSF